jgi:hypothetical protein
LLRRRHHRDYGFAAEFLQGRLEHLAPERGPLQLSQPLALLAGGV